MATKVTQKFIRNFLMTNPDAVNLDDHYRNNDGLSKEIHELRDTIAVSHGIYGLNGFIQRGRDTGTYYVCASRSSAMFYYL